MCDQTALANSHFDGSRRDRRHLADAQAALFYWSDSDPGVLAAGSGGAAAARQRPAIRLQKRPRRAQKESPSRRDR